MGETVTKCIQLVGMHVQHHGSGCVPVCSNNKVMKLRSGSKAVRGTIQ